MFVYHIGPAYVCQAPESGPGFDGRPTIVVFSAMPDGGSSGSYTAIIQTKYDVTNTYQSLSISEPRNLRFSHNCATIEYDAEAIVPNQAATCNACYKRYDAIVSIRWAERTEKWMVSLRPAHEGSEQ